MNPTEIEKLKARLATLGTPAKPSQAETIRELFESIHAAKGRGVPNKEIANEIGMDAEQLSGGYRAEAKRRGIKAHVRPKISSNLKAKD
jgi:hypothetical protein